MQPPTFQWANLPLPTPSQRLADLVDELQDPRTSQAEKRELIREIEKLSIEVKADTLLIPRLVSDAVWYSSRTTRPTIVDSWWYEDVGCLFAPGGVGKTTLLLFQVIHIVLGLDLFGYHVARPGPVFYLTAEDDRETLIARLRCMCQELGLSVDQTLWVRNNVHIIDVSGQGIKLTHIEKDVVLPTEYVAKMIERWKPYQPSGVIIDPGVSFGVGESRVNDAEQGLIDACRRVRNELLCAVLIVHHTGKANAREKALDQYAGRGGSALSDGSRMVHVMQSLTPEEWTAKTGDTLEPGESGIVYARPKVTWAPANQPTIYLKREGYLFTRYDHMDAEASAEVTLEKNVAKINTFLREEWTRGFKYSKDDLEKKKGFMRRDELREAVSHMEVQKMLIVVPESLGGRGAPKKVLQPADR